MNQRIPVTIVNHVAIDIAVAADIVWKMIIEEIGEARGFRSVGTVEPLEGVDAPLGGYRLTSRDENGALDERVARLTERDEAARRLSVFAEFLSVPGGMIVYATYQAQDAQSGTRFSIDCHTREEIELPTGASAADLSAKIAEKTAFYDDALGDKMQKTKEKLECEK
ncbi:hypothetical protein [Sphingosinicella microcystinivorans]|uniref:Uncharacterized protein n=1 Tax=Sphingosinicella microcystinivorans TaxID=335406 RepID=A0AAD1D6P6_SPHMI|nr:hypothetical protein [Sphingosinicella microcystinivorans]RKS91241.1 hypothetical protein DFR51_0798 [Sphingosinicella microcystinivorans]BBE34209.1 hypothetical protein SmB9_18670 [Sphingosinicella microcystinivorans]